MTLDEFVLVARATWPEWPGANASAFSDFVRPLLAAEVAPESLRAGDLWLAFHAGLGLTAAVLALETSCFAGLPSLLRARRADPAHVDEVVQRVRHHLLVAEPGARPRILGYEGRGELRAWVRVVAVRTWLNMKRDDKNDCGGLAAGAAGAPGDAGSAGTSGTSGNSRWRAALEAEATGDLELEIFKGKYRELFRRAFLEALEALAPGTRLLLKLHYLDKLSMDDVGKILGVHRLTVLRRLERARAELSEGTKERLEVELRLAPTEVESLLRMIQSRLDVSLEHALLHITPADMGLHAGTTGG